MNADGYLDLSLLWKKLIQEKNFTFPYEGDHTFPNENLSKLVELTLGHRLDKTDQFSNWERRPLREKQITYAALDAYCLLEIYKVLAVQCDKLNVPFHDICIQFHVSHQAEVKALNIISNNKVFNMVCLNFQMSNFFNSSGFSIQGNIGFK